VNLKTNAWRYVLIGGACLIVEYFAAPNITNQNIVYSLLGKVAVVSILVGVRLQRPRDRAGWYLLAISIGCFTVGDDVFDYYQVVVHNIPFPSYADAIYLIGYLFLFAGVLRLTRNPNITSNREDRCDAAIVALGAMALSWQFLMNSYVHDVTLSTFGMLVNVAYPMMDIALVFIVFRALFFRGARFTFQKLLAASVVTLFVADFIYDLQQLHNSYTSGNFVNAIYLIQYLLIAATALHPSVAAASREESARPERDALSLQRGRMPFVIVAGFVPPFILLVTSAAGVSVNVLAIATLCVVVLLLIGLRLVWLVGRITSQSIQLRDNVDELTSLEERFRLAFEDNMAPMLFTDLDDRVIAANDAFCELIGYRRDEVLGRDSVPFTYPDDVGISEESHRRISSGELSQSRYVKRYVRKDGRVIVVEVLRSLARDAQGRGLYNVISQRDITDERSLAAELSHQALHDSLTGLANRALFVDRLAQANARVEREGGMCAVLLLDLDDFKGVNDSLGHVAGDQLLIAVARRLERATRATDTLCRFGGDEFLYLAEGLASTEDAEQAAARLLRVLVAPFAVGDTLVEQHASIGVVVASSARADLDEFIQSADVALYEAKRRSKGRYALFTPTMHQQAASRFSLVQELRQALQSGEISMHYQPIIDLAGDTIVGFEALMRWRHPKKGMVPPAVFIPIAEQSNLILELGNFALRDAVFACASWHRAEDPSSRPFVTVNLSARQFHDPALVSTIERLLALSGLESERLVVEITESATLVNVTETMSVIEQLGRLGIAFPLDDFGTGFSSLSYLALLRPKIIKIDQSFVSPKIDTDHNDALLEAIVSLGHRLDMTMLAEGLETPAQIKRVRRIGCELGQGFFWSAAVPGDRVATLLQPSRHEFDQRVGLLVDD